MPGATSVTFTAGSTTPECITITLVDDVIYEGDETFTATISSVTPGDTIGTPSITTITIVDNDSKFNSKHTHTHAYARTHTHMHTRMHIGTHTLTLTAFILCSGCCWI